MKMFQSIVCINDWVFSTVPCSQEPYTDRIIQNMSLPSAISNLYAGFKDGRFGGWCSLNAEFFKMILSHLSVPCRFFNYGIRSVFTHATAIAEIDGDEYLFDPYFNRYYVIGGVPISFNKLMYLVNNNDTSEICSVYGQSLKYKEMKRGVWAYITGEWFEEKILSGFRKKIDLDNEIVKVFGNSNIFNLMKINWG